MENSMKSRLDDDCTHSDDYDYYYDDDDDMTTLIIQNFFSKRLCFRR